MEDNWSELIAQAVADIKKYRSLGLPKFKPIGRFAILFSPSQI